MAQRPWEVLKEQCLDLSEARDFVSKSLKEAATGGGSANLKTLNGALERVAADAKLAKIFQSNKRGVFRKVRCRGLAQILPLHITQVKVGLTLFLETFEMKFLPELQGLWICARKPTLESTSGFSCDSERLGVIVFPFQVEALVFAPRPGANLAANVTAVDADGLSCLVLDSFTVRIDLVRLLAGSSPKIDEEDEKKNVIEVRDAATKKVQTVKLGSKIKFSVYQFSGSRSAYSLEGTMRAGA